VLEYAARLVLGLLSCLLVGRVSLWPRLYPLLAGAACALVDAARIHGHRASMCWLVQCHRLHSIRSTFSRWPRLRYA
jgi:hypothetical protein